MFFSRHVIYFHGRQNIILLQRDYSDPCFSKQDKQTFCPLAASYTMQRISRKHWARYPVIASLCCKGMHWSVTTWFTFWFFHPILTVNEFFKKCNKNTGLEASYRSIAVVKKKKKKKGKKRILVCCDKKCNPHCQSLKALLKKELLRYKCSTFGQLPQTNFWKFCFLLLLQLPTKKKKTLLQLIPYLY